MVEAVGCLLVALDMDAFRTCARVGLMPHARQGGSGVWALAVPGTKLDGTGFEKLQIVQTHVAVLAGVGSIGGGRKGPSDRCEGEDVPFLDESCARAGDLDWMEARFDGFGKTVILADDLRNPA